MAPNYHNKCLYKERGGRGFATQGREAAIREMRLKQRVWAATRS